MLYIKMYQWILSTDLSPNEKIVFALLRSMYEQNGDEKTYCVEGSKREMARFLNMSNRTLEKYLKSLKAKRYLKCVASEKCKTIFYFQETETDRMLDVFRQLWHKSN